MLFDNPIASHPPHPQRSAFVIPAISGSFGGRFGVGLGSFGGRFGVGWGSFGGRFRVGFYRPQKRNSKIHNHLPRHPHEKSVFHRQHIVLLPSRDHLSHQSPSLPYPPVTSARPRGSRPDAPAQRLGPAWTPGQATSRCQRVDRRCLRPGATSRTSIPPEPAPPPGSCNCRR